MLALGAMVLLQHPEHLALAPRRRRGGRPDRRGAAALPVRRADRVPALRPRRPGAVRPAGPAGDVVVSSLSAATAIRRSRQRRSGVDTRSSTSTRIACRRRTTRSAMASTAASAPSWPGWSCGPPTRALVRRFPDLRSRPTRGAQLPPALDRLRRRVAPGPAGLTGYAARPSAETVRK